jgi:serine/threonine-protein kinase/endoribonuclease IRE1
MIIKTIILLLLLSGSATSVQVNGTGVRGGGEAQLAVVEPLLLVSTLDGLIYAIGQRSGSIKWTLRDEPLVRHPTRENVSDDEISESLLLTDPKDGSLYLLSRPAEPGSQESEQEALKKMPFTMKEVVSISPCHSSDGLLYMGRKVDSWLMIHSKTGQKVDVLDTESSTCKRESASKISPNEPAIFLTKSMYQLSIYDAKTRIKKWNITLVDYSSSASMHASKSPYPLLHLTSSTSGKILTIDLNSDQKTPQILWSQDLASPIVAIYEFDENGVTETRKVPFTTIGDDSDKMASESVPSLYVGESTSSKQLYALSAVVPFETRLLSSKKRRLSLPLIEGPDSSHIRVTPQSSDRRSQLLDFLMFGFYEYPDVSKVVLSATRPIGHRHHNLLESKPGNLIESSSRWPVLSASDDQQVNEDVVNLISLSLVLNICVISSTMIIVGSYLTRRYYSQSPKDVVQVGKISFHTTAIIGRGSAGTCVYKGLFEGTAAIAVKRVVNEHCVLAQREIDLLRSLQHPNVVRYYSTESDRSFKYIAIELAELTLADYMEQRDSYPDVLICEVDVFRDACMGLSHLHSVNVIHRDIKPQNILITGPRLGQRKALISDFGVGKTLSFEQSVSEFLSTTKGVKGTEGWIAPEVLRSKLNHEKEFKYSKQMDIFSLGCLAYYVFTGGTHPFGDPLERQSNILHDRSDLSDLSDEEHVTKSSLIRCMISHDPGERPSIGTILLHPIFWSRCKQLQFLQDVSDRIEKETEKSEVMVALETGKWDVIRGDWKRCLSDEIQAELNRHRWYPSNSVAALLRAIRNKKHHYRELSDDVQAILGSVPDQFMQYFDQKYPRLICHCYIALQSLRFESMFKEYYDQESAWDFTFPRLAPTGIKYFLQNSPSKPRPRSKKSRPGRNQNIDHMSSENFKPQEIDFENIQFKPNAGLSLFPEVSGDGPLSPLANWKSCVRPASTNK